MPADAEAICEAAQRPSMRFVSPKSIEQQDIQSIHRIREQLKTRLTAQTNQTRGPLLEYGIAIPQGTNHLMKQLLETIADVGIQELAAWLGLVPRQFSTGGKSTLLGISKRGDKYLRSLLVHGGRSVVRI